LPFLTKALSFAFANFNSLGLSALCSTFFLFLTLDNRTLPPPLRDGLAFEKAKVII